MENVEVTILGVSAYSFNDKETGRLVEGCNVWFIEKDPENNENAKGFVPRKATLPIDTFDKLKSLTFPHVAKAELTTKFSTRGAVTKITGFTGVRAIKIG